MHRINIITGCIAAALTLLFSCQKNGAPDENVYRVYATSDTVTEGEDTPVHLSFTDGGLRTDNKAWGDAWKGATFFGKITGPDGEAVEGVTFAGPDGILNDGDSFDVGGERTLDIAVGGLRKGFYEAIFNLRTRYGVDTWATTSIRVLGTDEAPVEEILLKGFSVPTDDDEGNIDGEGRLSLPLPLYPEGTSYSYICALDPVNAVDGQLEASSSAPEVVSVRIEGRNRLVLSPHAEGVAVITVRNLPDGTVVRRFTVAVTGGADVPVPATGIILPVDDGQDTGSEAVTIDAGGRLVIDINTFDEDNPYSYDVTVEPENADYGGLTAQSSDESILTAEISGKNKLVLTPHKPGTVNVTVSTLDGTVSRTFTVQVIARVFLHINAKEGTATPEQKAREVFPCSLTFSSDAKWMPSYIKLDVYAKATGRINLENESHDTFTRQELKNSRIAIHSVDHSASVFVFRNTAGTVYDVYKYVLDPATAAQEEILHSDDYPNNGKRMENYRLYSVGVTFNISRDYDPDVYDVVIVNDYDDPKYNIYRYLHQS